MVYENITDNGIRDGMAEDFGRNGMYDISVHCRNYSPGGRAAIMDMSDYSTCSSCRHQRSDRRCGLAERTLS